MGKEVVIIILQKKITIITIFNLNNFSRNKNYNFNNNNNHFLQNRNKNYRNNSNNFLQQSYNSNNKFPRNLYNNNNNVDNNNRQLNPGQHKIPQHECTEESINREPLVK